MEKLKEEYIASLKGKSFKIKEYINKRDLTKLKILIHSLKGSGATYGYPRITVLSSQMEKLIEKENWEGINEVKRKMEALFYKIKPDKES